MTPILIHTKHPERKKDHIRKCSLMAVVLMNLFRERSCSREAILEIKATVDVYHQMSMQTLKVIRMIANGIILHIFKKEYNS